MKKKLFLHEIERYPSIKIKKKAIVICHILKTLVSCQHSIQEDIAVLAVDGYMIH